MYPRLIFIFCLFVLGGCQFVREILPSLFDDKESERARKRKEIGFPEIPYFIQFDYRDSIDIKGKIEDASRLIALEKTPPTNINALYYRCQSDKKAMLPVLKSYGYFDASVKYKVNRRQDPVRVRVVIKANERYAQGKLTVDLVGDLNLSQEKLARTGRYVCGDFVDMDKIRATAQRLERYFKNRGYPFVQVKKPVGQLDRTAKTMDVYIKIILNERHTFGELQIEGNSVVPDCYIQNRLAWQTGQIYDARKVAETKQRLLTTGIFSTIALTPLKSDDKTTTMHLKVDKAPPRTISAGIRYTSYESIGVNAGWIHRNFSGNGDVFEVILRPSRKNSLMRVAYMYPDVGYKNVSAITEIQGRHERTKAYIGWTSDAFVGLRFSDRDYYEFSVGVQPDYSRLERHTRLHYARLLGVPIKGKYDTINDVINPTKGMLLSLELDGVTGKMDKKRTSFIQAKAYGASYWRLTKGGDHLIAFWGRLGFCDGSRFSKIPFHKRFYAGGVLSVRGYGLKMLSPLDKSGMPKGGKQLFEFGIEPRFKINEKIGFTIFAEGGKVEVGHSSGRNDFLWGVGAGFRYFTDIGPVRLDVAAPTKRRRSITSGRTVDAPYQLYISIGQAF